MPYNRHMRTYARIPTLRANVHTHTRTVFRASQTTNQPKRPPIPMHAPTSISIRGSVCAHFGVTGGNFIVVRNYVL